jgi:hypothetical protein
MLHSVPDVSPMMRTDRPLVLTVVLHGYTRITCMMCIVDDAAYAYDA